MNTDVAAILGVVLAVCNHSMFDIRHPETVSWPCRKGPIMAAESTSRYPTLRRTKLAIRIVRPVISFTLLAFGLTLFASQVLPRLWAAGFGIGERVVWAAIGLGYLVGFPIAAFVIFFLLGAAADLIDLWIDNEVAAEKTADLVERQLVPGVLRMCQLLEKTNESLASEVAARPQPELVSKVVEVRQQALDAVREAIRREWWDQARRLAASFAEQFPAAPEAKDLSAQVDAAFTRKIQSLREQLDTAERAADAEVMLNTRDRLSGYLNGTELYQVDRRVAHWMAAHLREALAAGRARDVVHLAERVVDAFGDTTNEGAQVRVALPTLRRSAGLCPDCGQPYDVSLVRCPACDAKRSPRKRAPAQAAKRP
jgi:hypothetical protein